MSLTTVECSRPGEAYTLFQSGIVFDVHLAGPGLRGGTGPCLCGFDRHRADIGFSVGGGHTGPGYTHNICETCRRLGAGQQITGTHRDLFATQEG